MVTVCYLGVEGLTLCVIDQFDSQWLMPIASDLGGQDNSDHSNYQFGVFESFLLLLFCFFERNLMLTKAI